uniref:Uncharacterized protein n=1 Tax=Glossina palpalis gambiensis TaxID=67801 RepID=A0A1B0BYX1_9MUSC
MVVPELHGVSGRLRHIENKKVPSNIQDAPVITSTSDCDSHTKQQNRRTTVSKNSLLSFTADNHINNLKRNSLFNDSPATDPAVTINITKIVLPAIIPAIVPAYIVEPDNRLHCKRKLS